MNNKGNPHNLNQELEKLQARVKKSEIERAHWKTLALENQQTLIAEQDSRRETERALHNAEFLARASAFLTGTFDYETNLDHLVRLLANEFADWSAVDLLNDAANKLQRVAVASKNPDQEELLRNTYNYYPLNLDGPHPIAQVLREKKPLLGIPTVQTPVSGELNSPNPASDPTNFSGNQPNQSYLVVPLLTGNELLGVFIFVRLTGKDHPFDEAELTLAEDLAVKVALMVQNSRLYEKLETALENQQELNYYKDLYLSILSHELRNPLASIRGYTQIIWRSLLAKQQAAAAENDKEKINPNAKDGPVEASPDRPDFDKEFRSLNILINQSDRMNRMVNELLDFSRIQKNNFELNYLTTVDLVDLVRKVVEAQSHSVKTHHFEIVANQPEIKGIFDENRLEQVFTNLISNALKYSPNETTIKITLTFQPTESLVEDAPDFALIAIQDEGQGIDKEAQEKLFEKYYRVRTEKNRMVQGLGLGLYICKEIVRQHHGELWVESEPEKGSTFYVSLPLKPPRSAI